MSSPYVVPASRRPLISRSLALHVGHPLVPDLERRLLTGSAFSRHPRSYLPVLVTRSRPKPKAGAYYRTCWPQLAPSLALLHAPPEQISGWDQFARAYRAELDTLPSRHRFGALLQLADWLQEYAGVILVSFEELSLIHLMQGRGQRHVLRDWLLGRPLNLSEED
jgi:uncharacterized protein YeaO (DUF488 family)